MGSTAGKSAPAARKPAANPRRGGGLARVGASSWARDAEPRQAAPGRVVHDLSRVPTQGPPPAAGEGSQGPSLSGLEPGVPLPASLRERAESFFGADLGAVRVHSGAASSQAAASLGARAFTLGHHIALARRTDAHDSRLMAHEIAHTLQPQSGASRTASSGPIAARDDPAEREARSAGNRFVAGGARAAPFPLRVRRTSLLHRDARHPDATVFDAEYNLYALDGGTDYDGSNQRYYLSPWDRTHLIRSRGLYYLRSSQGLQLVAPPEIRRAIGGRGVLIPLQATEIMTRFSAEPRQFARAVARRAHGVQVDTVTLSTQGDRDFTHATLPRGVAGALGSPLQGVVSGDQASQLEATRRRAVSTRQERTLGMGGVRGGDEFPMRELTSADRMDVNTLFGRDTPGRAEWYVERLGAFQAQLFESAQSNRIPMQLLATVILNELADINWLDVLQSGPSTFRGSLGIAQIQIDTARANQLVDSPSHRAGLTRAGLAGTPGHRHDIDSEGMVELGERLHVGQLLQVPQVAIEAAAREIALQLTRMVANRQRPWQIEHHFNATGLSGDSIYDDVDAGHPMNREGTLARAVAGAYNSPGVVTTDDTSRFPNANIHGSNAAAIAQDLFRARLFRAR